MIPRLIEDSIITKLKESGKIILLLGARQVGKTTLVRNIQTKLEAEGNKTLYLNCDIAEERVSVNTASRIVIEHLIANIDVLLIDEAQGLDNPGLTLKNIHAIAPYLKVLATGSSSFELKNRLSDPLTGRYIDLTLYPLSFMETLGDGDNEPFANPIIVKNKADALLPSTLLYGLYPEVYLKGNPTEKAALLDRLIESYLFKDILTFQKVKNSQAIKDLTRALAYQIGSEVNENELSKRLKIDRKTVVSYLEVLEKSYVIVKIHPYSKNPRREIGKNYKVYFVDLGIRNALIGDFNSPELRADLGFLWENFLFMERQKYFANKNQKNQTFFWRSYGGAEVDYLEKSFNTPLKAYEFKYRNKTLSKGAGSFTGDYQTSVSLITRENYLQFIKSDI